MKETIFTVNPTDNQKVFANYYGCEDNQGLVVIFHGMAEHKERYNAFASYLQGNKFAVLVCDHRGHGESLYDQTIKGHFAHHDGWFLNLDDLHELVKQAQSISKQKMYSLIGHSMGAIVAQSYFKRHSDEITHMLLTGMPEIPSPLPVVSGFAKILSKQSKTKESDLLYKTSFLRFDKLTQSKEHLSWLSHNQENIKAYLEDPLCGFKFTSQGFVDLVEGFKDIKSLDSEIKKTLDTSIWFLVGEDDVTINVDQIQKRMEHYQSIGYHEVALTMIVQTGHEVLFDDCKEEIYPQILHFLKNNHKV